MIHCFLNELDGLYCEQVLNSLNILNNLNTPRHKKHWNLGEKKVLRVNLYSSHLSCIELLNAK